MTLPEEFSTYTSKLFGEKLWTTFLRGMQEQPPVSVRLNPFKYDAATMPLPSDEDGMVEWCPEGRYLQARPLFTLDPLLHAGAYYVQEAASMYVTNVVRRFADLSAPLRVLDLCAAPGGKSTAVRGVLPEGSLLMSNEPMRPRANILMENVRKFGHPDVIVTNNYAIDYQRSGLKFDVIIADVPCSGEGMFRKDAKAVEDWSENVVNLCSARQKRILADVWPALRRGGSLIYSTCTFEDAENDAVMEWTADELGGTVHEYDYSSLEGVIPTKTGGLLVPGFVKGEGQFVSALIKNTGVDGFRLSGKPAVGAAEKRKGNLLIHIPGSIVREVAALEPLRPIQIGVAKGELKGRDLVPSADWALSLALPDGAYPVADLDRETALRFLHRDSIFLKDAPKGFVLVRFEGHPLGFVKNLGTRCNNLHPQGRKIKMDV